MAGSAFPAHVRVVEKSERRKSELLAHSRDLGEHRCGWMVELSPTIDTMRAQSAVECPLIIEVARAESHQRGPLPDVVSKRVEPVVQVSGAPELDDPARPRR
jgi:hypothetical protein